MISQEKNLSIGRRDISIPQTHWCELDEKNCWNGNKTILILPGGAVASAFDSNGCAKRFLATFDIDFSKINVISAYYNGGRGRDARWGALKSVDSLIDLMQAQPNENFIKSPDYKPFFYSFFKPLILDENGQPNKIEKICENLRKLLIVGYCYGSFVAFDLSRILEETLEKFNFKKSDIDKALKHLTIIATSTRIPFQKSKATTVHLNSFADRDREMKWKRESFQGFLNTRDYRTQNGAFCFFSNQEAMLYGQKLLCYETNDHHFRSYFYDADTSFKKTTESEEMTRFISRVIEEWDGENDTPINLLNMKKEFSNSHVFQTHLLEGNSLLEQYEKYKLECKIERELPFKLLEEDKIFALKRFIEKKREFELYQNKDGDFLIHKALEKKNKGLIKLIMKKQPLWFQCYNAKKEHPIEIALKNKDYKLAKFMFKVVSQTYLPPYENYLALNNIKRDVFYKGLENMLKSEEDFSFFKSVVFYSSNRLPVLESDFELIQMQYEKIKKEKPAFFKEAKSLIYHILNLAVESNKFKKHPQKQNKVFEMMNRIKQERVR